MADKTLTELTAGVSITAADLFLATQAGSSRKVTGAQLAAWMDAQPEHVLANLGALGKLSIKAASFTPTLNGTSVTIANAIPTRAIVLGVTTYVRTALSGTLTSFNVGDSSDSSRFGGSVDIAAGSSNIGVVGPFATYAPTGIVLTAVGGSGTSNASKIRIVAYYLAFDTPTD